MFNSTTVMIKLQFFFFSIKKHESSQSFVEYFQSFYLLLFFSLENRVCCSEIISFFLSISKSYLMPRLQHFSSFKSVLHFLFCKSVCVELVNHFGKLEWRLLDSPGIIMHNTFVRCSIPHHLTPIIYSNLFFFYKYARCF